MKKKKIFFTRRFGESAELDPNMWTVPYGDMMTNLMIFFLILFALTSIQMKVSKVKDEQLFVKKLEKFGKVIISADKIKVTFPQDIIFSKGSAQLSEDFKNAIYDVSGYLKDNSGTVIVAGHADSMPLYGGKYKDNWYLSAERGWSVVAELIKNGIEPKRLQIRGYGEFNPVASNKTDDGRAKNRRIEMTILKIQEEQVKKFFYYKTTGGENLSDISKKVLGNENYTQEIQELNSDKVDSTGKVLGETEILIPY